MALSSGTAALHLALIAAGVHRGDTVLVPSFTFAASANAVMYLGARPVFLDSDAGHLERRPGAGRRGAARPGRPRAAAAGGDRRRYVRAVRRLRRRSLTACDRYGVPLIEDAAEALGASYRGRAAGSFGAGRVLSFNGNKIITTGGGGMLVTDDGRVAARTRHLATQAREPVPHYEHRSIGYNYRLSNLLAAIGRGQLQRLDDLIAARRENARFYERRWATCRGSSSCRSPTTAHPTGGSAAFWSMRSGSAPTATRSSLQLGRRNIEARPAWKPMHLQPVFADCVMRGGAVSADVFERGVCLPSGSAPHRRRPAACGGRGARGGPVRPMRIVYIYQYYCNPQMAGGMRAYEHARRLVAHGHTVHVITADITPGRRSLGWRRTLEEGVHVHWFSVPYSNNMSYARRIRAFAEFMVLAAAKATRLNADLVFATSTPLTVAVPGVIAARLRRVPFVFEVRDLWPEVPIEMGALRHPAARRLAGALASFAYRNAAEVIALSPGMAAGVAARRPGTRTTVVPNAADLELFDVAPDAVRRFRAEHRWLGDRPLIVYTGALGAVNGVDYLVRAARRMRGISTPTCSSSSSGTAGSGTTRPGSPPSTGCWTARSTCGRRCRRRSFRSSSARRRCPPAWSGRSVRCGTTRQTSSSTRSPPGARSPSTTAAGRPTRSASTEPAWFSTRRTRMQPRSLWRDTYAMSYG